MSIDETLKAREARYGSFSSQAALAQQLKGVMKNSLGWGALAPFQKEALEMIQHKVSRILNGDPDYPDNWHDISGYSQLVENKLEEDVE